MPLPVGTTFAGYTIVRLLGSGGMGEVYLAQHPRLPRGDALKVLPRDVSADSVFRERFQREADMAATLFHPHIVSVHDRGEFNGQLWISMDYIEGTDAAQLTANRYPEGMPAAEIATIVTAVASALDYAHQGGLLHRDVKPANILLTEPDGDGHRRIFLADFGIARQAGDISGITATNLTIGTAAYCAPEQLVGADIDGRADQYALATTAFHLLTGAPPYQHSNPVAVISQHLNAPPPKLSDQRPELASLDLVFATAMAKRPNDRYPSCRDFARALTQGVTPDVGMAAQRPDDRTMAAGIAPAPLNAVDTRAAPMQPMYWHPAMPAAQPAARRRTAVSIVVPLVLAAMLLCAISFAAVQVLRPGPRPATAAPQWQPYVEYAKQFGVFLTSLDPQTADRDVQRILDGSTGTYHDDFASRRSEFKQTIVNSNVVTHGIATGAGLEAISGTTARVVVAMTSKVTNNAGATQDPRSWRLLMQVEKIGDTYLVSNVEFVR
ncbi:protein kinase [Mycobacterium kansasii]|uniref:non-specific serine/threonine protein kinase n=1 Tax=Mycobacterium innocens TaxID=2341083 RepID=A0A498QEY4_9MYCO|nr:MULTISPECIES: serine/threonine-protein kinase [Mycobacterium]KZS77125.1 protein kinase [Mycobacterium kansasii]VBA42150.1 Serine/threonine-protein kinase PknF [Mycobacterium innocens]